MTQTVERPRLSRPAPPARRSSPSVLLPGATAAGWALVAGLVLLGLPVLLAWATDSRSGSGALAATQSIGQLWLVAHGTGLTVPTGAVHLTPLGLTVVPLLLLHRAGRHAARTLPVTDSREAARLSLAMATPYGLAAAVLAALATTDDVQPHTAQALCGGLFVALVGATSGIVREAGIVTVRLPDRARWLLRATAVSAATLVAGGGLFAGAAVLTHAGRVTSLSSATDPGLVGGLALLALGLAFIPNAVLWGVAWVTGPGFAIGVGTTVSPWSTSLGAVPAFPLLGGLPSSGTPVWLGVVALLVPVGAGVLGGLVVARRLTDLPLWRAALEGLAVAPCLALVVLLLTWVSGGPLGDGRLTAVGPSPWRVGLAVLAEVALPAAAAAAAGMRFRR